MTRKPYQGVVNIIRFNWHFYLFAGITVLLFVVVSMYASMMLSWLCLIIALGTFVSTSISLIVSYYIYDRSSLYKFTWMSRLPAPNTEPIVNIHAGFDETSVILKEKFPGAALTVFDFYNPVKHTERSIERARKAYPRYPGTITTTTSQLLIPENSSVLIFNIFALHEVRDQAERIQFLKEQRRSLKTNGRIIIVEHLRDTSNFAAYTIGFFHFLSRREWLSTFALAGLSIDTSFKVTPFITVFILKK